MLNKPGKEERRVYVCKGSCKCSSKNVAKSISDDTGRWGLWQKLLQEESGNGSLPGMLSNSAEENMLEHTEKE